MNYYIHNDVLALQMMRDYILWGIGISFFYIISLVFIRNTKNKFIDEQLKTKKEEDLLVKHNSVYGVIILLWLILTILGVTSFIKNIQSIYSSYSTFLLVLLTVNILFIIYFWLNGTKDIVYCLFYYFKKDKIINKEVSILHSDLPDLFRNRRVYLLYCTCNDFIAESLYESMKQTHWNVKTFILDDSDKEEYINEIDLFALENDVEVIRRESRIGFKAGNLNNFLQNNSDYDYFVILDSDEIIPPNFINDALHYFAYYSNMGILQATHISTRNKTKFMKRFSKGVDSHWPTYQSIKEKYGFLSFLGHGAMISNECYTSVGAFPQLVAEDICFTLEAKFKGYFTGFSNLIICQEEYPIDYFAFKKRHLKWTGGNLEFIKHYGLKIFKSKELSWYEKIDVALFTFSLPLSSVFFIFLSINLIVLPYFGYSAGYPIWLMTPTTIFLLAPTFNDRIFLAGNVSLFRYVQYLFSSFLLYGSLYWLSLYGATKALFGIKPKFIVTPKDERKYSFRELISGNVQEILFSFLLIGISLMFTHSLLPVILIVFPSLSGMYLSYLYKPIKEDSEEDDDE